MQPGFLHELSTTLSDAIDVQTVIVLLPFQNTPIRQHWKLALKQPLLADHKKLFAARARGRLLRVCLSSRPLLCRTTVGERNPCLDSHGSNTALVTAMLSLQLQQ